MKNINRIRKTSRGKKHRKLIAKIQPKSEHSTAKKIGKNIGTALAVSAFALSSIMHCGGEGNSKNMLLPIASLLLGNKSSSSSGNASVTNPTHGNPVQPTHGTGTATSNEGNLTPINTLSVYASPTKLFFSPLQDGQYAVQYANGSVKIFDGKSGFTYSTDLPFTKILSGGKLVGLKDLLNPQVDIIKFPALVANPKKYMIVAGTNNSTTFDAVLTSAYIKKLISELQKTGQVDLLLYTIGMGIEAKAIILDQKLKASPSYTGVWDGIIAVSQGNNVEENLEKLGTIKSYGVIVRLVPPDMGTLGLINEKAFANKDFLFLLSPEYTDFIWSPTKSKMYENIATTCALFRTKTNAITISINTLGSNGDMLLPQTSHFYCAPQTGRVVYKTNYSHFSMDSDPRLVDITLAALKGDTMPSEIVDPSNSGALAWLNEINQEADLRGLHVSMGLDGASLVGELRTQSGTSIASLRIVDLKGNPDLYLGNLKVGEFYLDSIGAVQFNATSITFPSIPGLAFTFNVKNQSFTSSNGNETYSIDLNTQTMTINGTVVGKISDVSNMKIISVPISDVKAGNILVTKITYDPSKNTLNGIYKDAFWGQEIAVRISFAEDKLYLGGVLLGSFSKYINGQLDKFSQQVMNEIPAELKTQFDSITKGLVVNSVTVDPAQRIITHISKDLGNGSSIELIFVLGKDAQGIYLRTLDNSSFIRIAIENNNNLLLHVKKFELRGNIGQNLSGELEILGGTRIHKKIKNASMEMRLLGAGLLTAVTNPIAFTAAVVAVSNAGSDQKQMVTGFVAGTTWGATVGGALIGPAAAIPALMAFFSEVEVDANVNFETALKMKLKDNVFSIPKSKIIGAGADVNAAWKLFGISELPNLTLAAGGSLNIYIESLNLSKTFLLSGDGSLTGTIKVFFADILSADASISSFSILTNIGANPKTESKGQITLNAKIRASAFLKLFTITEENLNLTLTHLKEDTYTMPLKRARWDVFSDAIEEGTINFKITPDKKVSIISSDLRISGRGGTLGQCPSQPVTVRGGNNILIEEGRADCRIEIRINLFGKGNGGFHVATIPTGSTKIPSLGIEPLK
jgi:hypothetical protein